MNELDAILKNPADPRHEEASRIAEQMLKPLRDLKQTVAAVRGLDALKRMNSPLDLVLQRLLSAEALTSAVKSRPGSSWTTVPKLETPRLTSWIENLDAITQPKLHQWPVVDAVATSSGADSALLDLDSPRLPDATVNEVWEAAGSRTRRRQSTWPGSSRSRGTSGAPRSRMPASANVTGASASGA